MIIINNKKKIILPILILLIALNFQLNSSRQILSRNPPRLRNQNLRILLQNRIIQPMEPVNILR